MAGAATTADEVQDAPRHESQDTHVDQGADEGDRDRQTGQEHGRGEGDKGDGGRDRDRRSYDPLELVGADAEIAAVVGTVRPQHDDPREGQQHVRDDPEQAGLIAETTGRLAELRGSGQARQRHGDEIGDHKDGRVRPVPGRQPAMPEPRRVSWHAVAR